MFYLLEGFFVPAIYAFFSIAIYLAIFSWIVGLIYKLFR